MREKIVRWLARLKEEKGQSIILLALAVVVLLAFVGMAIDVGLLYGRRIQLSRAVDAAALAGAMELPDGPYQDRAEQFVRTNGFDPVEANVIAAPGVGVGQSNYLTVTAQLPMDTMFLRFVGFPTVHVPALAVAEFRSPAPAYTPMNGQSGVAGLVNLNVFGHGANPEYGDAFSPDEAPDLPGQVCSCADPCPNDDWRKEVSGRNGPTDDPGGWGVYPFAIHVPADYQDENGTSIIQVEILDPDDCNRENAAFRGSCSGNKAEVTLLGGAGTSCGPITGTLRSTTAMADRPDTENIEWFVRMDQNCDFCGGWDSYQNNYGVETQYTLYYYKQGEPIPIEISQYTIKDTDCSEGTDLEWVIPGETHGTATTGPDDFRFNLDEYLDARDENGNWSFYLDVEGISGTGGNGYDLWAGPPHSVYTTNVNLRNVYLLNEINEGRYPLSSGGVAIWAMGFLPLNVNTDTTYTVTLAYIPPKSAGITVTISNFDLDRDTRTASHPFWGDPPDPILGLGPCDDYCENLEPWPGQCYGQKLEYLLEGHAWPGHLIGETWPGDVSCNSRFGEADLPIPHEFYGSFLYAVFETSQNDTTDWKLEYQGVVDSTFVRLIK